MDKLREAIRNVIEVLLHWIFEFSFGITPHIKIKPKI